MEVKPAKKRIRKASAESENESTVENQWIENPVDSNASYVSLNLTYDILRIVFTYLNGMDLGRAAMVCRYINRNMLMIGIHFNPTYMIRILYSKGIMYK